MTAELPIATCEEWRILPLKALTTKIGSGSTPKGGAQAYLPSRAKYAFVRSQNVLDRGFDESGLAFISDDQAVSLKGVELRENDVLLNITGDGVTFGRACLIPTSILPACVNQHVAIIRANPEILDPGFLLAYLTHPGTKGYIESFNAGGSRRAITKGHIESFAIPVPPISTQRSISHILGTLDDKIEVNRKTNETLEAIAQALFKSWFVDFAPIRAKAEGRPTGLPDDLDHLFPDSLVETEIGEAPHGWLVTTLSDETTVLTRGISPAYCETDGLPVINQKCIRDHQVDMTKARLHDLAKKSIGGKSVARFDALVNSTGVGTLGRVAMMPAVEGNVTVDSHVTIVRGRDAAHSLFLAYTLMNREVEVENLGEGSTGQTELSRTRLGGLEVLIPSAPILTAFFEQVGPIEDRREVLVRESSTLASLRDALLPKLISGELRIPMAETVLEAAGV